MKFCFRCGEELKNMATDYYFDEDTGKKKKHQDLKCTNPLCEEGCDFLTDGDHITGLFGRRCKRCGGQNVKGIGDI